MPLPVVFISYCHENKGKKDELSSHLKLLGHINLIDEWSDELIPAGGQWHQEILGAIERADLVILLITKEFFNSNYITETEVPRILERHDNGEGKLTILPIIASHCQWGQIDWLAKLQVRPKDGKPVWARKTSDRDKVLSEIAHEVAEMFEARDRGTAPTAPEVTPRAGRQPPRGPVQRAKKPRGRTKRFVARSPKFQQVVLALIAVFLSLWVFSTWTTKETESSPLTFTPETPGSLGDASFAVTVISSKNLSPNEYEDITFKVRNLGSSSYEPKFKLMEDKSTLSWHFETGSNFAVGILESTEQKSAKNRIKPYLDITQVGKFLGEPIGLSLSGDVQGRKFLHQDLPLRFASLPWIQMVELYSGLLTGISLIYFMIIRGWRLAAYRI